MRSYGNKPRTQAQKAISAQLWIAGCRDNMLRITADELCERHGVVNPHQRAAVATALLRRQLQAS